MCVGCREFKDKKDLIRLVRTAEGQIILDQTGKLAGRGAYLCHDVACLQQAVKKHSLERSFKGKISADILQQLESFLTKEEAEDVK